MGQRFALRRQADDARFAATPPPALRLRCADRLSSGPAASPSRGRRRKAGHPPSGNCSSGKIRGFSNPDRPDAVFQRPPRHTATGERREHLREDGHGVDRATVTSRFPIRRGSSCFRQHPPSEYDGTDEGQAFSVPSSATTTSTALADPISSFTLPCRSFTPFDHVEADQIGPVKLILAGRRQRIARRTDQRSFSLPPRRCDPDAFQLDQQPPDRQLAAQGTPSRQVSGGSPSARPTSRHPPQEDGIVGEGDAPDPALHPKGPRTILPQDDEAPPVKMRELRRQPWRLA